MGFCARDAHPLGCVRGEVVCGDVASFVRSTPPHTTLLCGALNPRGWGFVRRPKHNDRAPTLLILR